MLWRCLHQTHVWMLQTSASPREEGTSTSDHCTLDRLHGVHNMASDLVFPPRWMVLHCFFLQIIGYIGTIIFGYLFQEEGPGGVIALSTLTISPILQCQ